MKLSTSYDLKNLEEVKILTLLAVFQLFLFSAPSLVPVPSISNSPLKYPASTPRKIHADVHALVRASKTNYFAFSRKDWTVD